MTVKAFTVVPSRSGVLRPQAEREVLNLFGARMAAVSLSGYIFFGSSLSISDQVHCSCPVDTPPVHPLPGTLHMFYRGPPTPPLTGYTASVLFRYPSLTSNRSVRTLLCCPSSAAG